MRSQFIYCENRTLPDGAEYLIYHSKTPRFFARIVHERGDVRLELEELIDPMPEGGIEGKLKRAAKWYNNYLIYLNNGKGY